MPLEDKLRILIEQHGAENVSLGLKKVNTAFDASINRMQKFERPARGVMKWQNAISKETKNTGREMGGMINVLGEMGYSFSTAIPPLRTMGTQMAMAGGSAYQMGAAFGPLGAGVGALIGVMPTLISLVGDSSSEMESAASRALSFAQRLERLNTQIENMHRAQRIQSGRGSAREQRTALVEAQEALAAARRGYREALDITGMSLEEREELRQNLSAVIEQREQIVRELEQFNQSDFFLQREEGGKSQAEIDDERSRGLRELDEQRRREAEQAERERERNARRGEQEAERRRREAERAAAELERRIQRAQEEARRAAEQADKAIRRMIEQQLRLEEAASRNITQAIAGKNQEIAEDMQEAYDALTSDAIRRVDELVEAWDRYNEALVAAGEQSMVQADLIATAAEFAAGTIQDMIGDKAKSAFQSAIGAWVDGSKSFGEAAAMMAEQAIQAIVVEAIVRAAMEGAHAIAALASFNYAGAAAHAVAAAEYAGVALVAGTVGVATGAIGGGGGEAPSATGPSTPRSSDFDGPANDNAGGAPSITVIVNDPGDAARAGEVSQRHERAARQVYSGRV